MGSPRRQRCGCDSGRKERAAWPAVDRTQREPPVGFPAFEDRGRPSMGEGAGEGEFLWDEPQTSFWKLLLKQSGVLSASAVGRCPQRALCGPGKTGTDARGKAECSY